MILVLINGLLMNNWTYWWNVAKKANFPGNLTLEAIPFYKGSCMHACTVANEIPFYKFNDVFHVISKLLCQCVVTMRNRRKCTLFCILMIFLHPYFPWKKSVLKCHHQSASHVFWGNNLINHSNWRHYLTLFYSFLTDGKWMATFFQVRMTTNTVWKKEWRKCIKKRFLTIKYLGMINQ